MGKNQTNVEAGTSRVDDGWRRSISCRSASKKKGQSLQKIKNLSKKRKVTTLQFLKELWNITRSWNRILLEYLGYLVAQCWRIILPMEETQVWSLGWEAPLEKEMATHSSILAWEIPWTEEAGRLWTIGSQRVEHSWRDSTHTWIDHRTGNRKQYFTGRNINLRYACETTLMAESEEELKSLLMKVKRVKKLT